MQIISPLSYLILLNNKTKVVVLKMTGENVGPTVLSSYIGLVTSEEMYRISSHDFTTLQFT